MDHSYPGNVRELENIIERAISFANTPEILQSDLPSYIAQSPAQNRTSIPRLKDAIRTLEKETIQMALREADGNISRAASVLGIYRQQLQRTIKSLKIAT
jgi:transcriptional regulator with PAS, ATPase and Fis domain